jgi:hypothetical protein
MKPTPLSPNPKPSPKAEQSSTASSSSSSKAQVPSTELIQPKMLGEFSTTAMARKCFEGFLLWFTGDFVAQTAAAYYDSYKRDAKSNLEQPLSTQSTHRLRRAWDPVRSFRQGVFGGFVFAPLRARWLVSLDRVFATTAIPTNDAKALLQMNLRRVASDQLIFTPVTMVLYFCTLAIGELSVGSMAERCVMGVPDVAIVSWFTWLPTQAFAFRYVPRYYWTPLMNAVTIPWTAYLSWMNHRLREYYTERAALAEKQRLARKEQLKRMRATSGRPLTAEEDQ